MAVPQGNTIEEWLQCAKHMLDWPIASIGVSKFCTPQYGPHARYRCVQALRELELSLGRDPIAVHLLGCWEDPREIGEVAKVFDIRGCDSIIAYWFSQADLIMDTSMNTRPEGHPDFDNGLYPDPRLLATNIERWRSYCRGELR